MYRFSFALMLAALVFVSELHADATGQCYVSDGTSRYCWQGPGTPDDTYCGLRLNCGGVGSSGCSDMANAVDWIDSNSYEHFRPAQLGESGKLVDWQFEAVCYKTYTCECVEGSTGGTVCDEDDEASYVDGGTVYMVNWDADCEIEDIFGY